MFTLSQKQLLFLSIISLVFFFTFFVLINPLITNAYTITEELSIIGDLNISGTEVTLGSETFNQGKYMSFNLNQGGSKIYDDVHMHIVTDDYLFLESRERVFVTTDLEVWGSLIADLFQGEFEGNLTGDVEGTVTGSLIGNATGLSGNPSLTVNNLTTLGIVTLPNNSITDAMIPNSITASKYFPVIGGTINGNVKLNDHNITNIRTLSTTNLTVFGTIKFPNNSLTDNMIPNTITASNYLPLSGGTMSGDINLGTNDLTNGGSITATSFSGNLTGNVTGSLSGGSVDITALTMASGASSGYVLTTDGSGVASWTDVSSTGGPWTLSGSNLYPDDISYNVGIGTTSPTEKLEVQGNSRFSGNISIANTIINPYKYLNLELSTAETANHHYGSYIKLTQTAAASKYTYGSSSILVYTGTENYSGMYAAYNTVTNAGSGTLTSLFGAYDYASNQSSGSVTNVWGTIGQGRNTGSGLVTNAYGGVFISDTSYGEASASVTTNAVAILGRVNNTNGSGATIVTAKGLDLSGWTKSGTINTSYGIYMDTSVDIGTNHWALYSSSTSNSYFAGNVGIGTTAPNYGLELSETTGANLSLETKDTAMIDGDDLGTILFRGIGSSVRTGAMIKAEVDTNTWGDINDAPTELQFFTQADGDTDTLTTPRMVIDQLGYVGIGTTNPSTYLDVSSGMPTPLMLSRTGGDTNVNIKYHNDSGSIYAGINSSSIFAIDDDADLGDASFKIDATNGNLLTDLTMTGTTPTLTIGDSGMEDTSVIFHGNAQDYHVGLDDTNDSFEVGLGSILGTSSFLNIIPSGNVGIGTTSPSTSLHVLRNNTDYTMMIENNSVSSSAHGLSIDIASGSVSNALYVVSNSTPKFVMKADGYMGINKGTASSALDITGNIRQDYANSASHYFYSSATIYTGLDLNTDNRNLTIRNVSDSNGGNIILQPDIETGNVGIGTTNPSQKLEVYNGVLKINRDDGTDSYIHFYEDTFGSSWSIGSKNNGSFVIGGGEDITTGQVLVIDGDHDVGIGSTNPTAKLEVTSVIRSTPSDAPGTCDANTEGGMYYDASMNEPCFCDGVNWVQFDGGGNCI